MKVLIGITAGLALVMVALLMMLSLAHPPRQQATASGTADQSLGISVASSLIIPGEDEWPWPLALEAKSRYTEADAAAVRPDLGAIDVSSLTSRRKAQLESILDAVD